MAYPTLQLLVSARAGRQQRASALGVYRFFRDFGYAVGALGMGWLADRFGLTSALWGAAGVAALAVVVMRGVSAGFRAPSRE
jgi:predicted MFS family arabinose efflux permease